MCSDGQHMYCRACAPDLAAKADAIYAEIERDGGFSLDELREREFEAANEAEEGYD
jgi:hypothetical protein